MKLHVNIDWSASLQTLEGHTDAINSVRSLVMASNLDIVPIHLSGTLNIRAPCMT